MGGIYHDKEWLDYYLFLQLYIKWPSGIFCISISWKK